MFTIFVSASVPGPKDSIQKKYPVDKQAIRDALIAIIDVLLPTSVLIWGGHPSITGMIAEVLCHQEKEELIKHFHLYQSKYFASHFPPENSLFPVENQHLTPARFTVKKSLTIMREEMLMASRPIDMAIFMGGREEGLKEELLILKKNHPHALILPLAATGGYSKCIYENLCSVTALTTLSLSRGLQCNRERENISNNLYDACNRYRFHTLFSQAISLMKERDYGKKNDAPPHR